MTLIMYKEANIVKSTVLISFEGSNNQFDPCTENDYE